MKEELPLYNICIADDLDGVQVVSLVHDPAVERNFIAMSKDSKPQKIKFSTLDEDKHLVTGLIIPADTPIYRYDEIHGEHFVTFTKEVIRELLYKFFREGLTSSVNTEHWNFAEGVYLVESYIKDSERGISPAEFDDVPDGSWFGTYRIANEDIWQRIKKGDFRGFSIEGFLSYEEPEIESIEQLMKVLNEA